MSAADIFGDEASEPGVEVSGDAEAPGPVPVLIAVGGGGGEITTAAAPFGNGEVGWGGDDRSVPLISPPVSDVRTCEEDGLSSTAPLPLSRGTELPGALPLRRGPELL